MALLATKAQAAERVRICRSCPELIKKTMQCGICYCFVKLKSKLRNKKCPAGKWPALPKPEKKK